MDETYRGRVSDKVDDGEFFSITQLVEGRGGGCESVYLRIVLFTNNKLE